jgi:hypothetical protein
MKPATILLYFLLVCLLVACAPTVGTPASSSPTPGTQVVSGSATPATLTAGSSTPELGLPPATPTPTRDHSGVNWQEMPIIPEISARVLQIFQDGQAQGRDPQHFSVVGDCQSIPYVFLGPFGRGELAPDPVESYLWDALNYFEESFDTWSVTSRGGFTAASILNPIQADPHYCKPGESPLTCEYRLNNPAYVFITLEIWDNQATIDRYELYLRTILDYVIERGSVPILLTKADAAEVDDGRHVINPAVVHVALDYDIPVVNFWRAAQYLDNIGIDPDRDGFHLSQEGYDLKNILALRTLYAIWQAVDPDAAAGQAGTTGTTPTPIPGTGGVEVLPQVASSPCASNCVYFSTARSQDGLISSGGVYVYDVSNRQLSQLLGEGFDLQDVSEDGSRLLVNQANYLYAIHLGDGSYERITDTFLPLGRQGAYWNQDDTTIVYIDQAHPYAAEAGSAYTLFPSTRDGEVYFEAGACESKGFCQSTGLYRLDLDQTLTALDTYTRPVFSPDGGQMAFLNPAAATKDNYFHIGYLLLEEPDRGAVSRRIFYFPEEGGFMVYPDVREYAFSPDNQYFMMIYDIYSAYFERSLRLQTYLIDLSTGILYNYGGLEGLSGSLNPRLVWSPGSDRVLFFFTDPPTAGEYAINLYLTDLASGEKLIPYHASLLTDESYFYITNLFWR